MWREFSMQGNDKWLDLLPKLVHKYNHTTHSTISMKPADVTMEHEKMLLRTVFRSRMPPVKKPKFKEGDHVRISKYRSAFAKGYTPNWGTEVFKIVKVQNTVPRTYLLQDYKGDSIQGGFYQQELQKVNLPNAYLVEKVLRRKGDKCYVKWLGFDNRHNSWINKDNVI